MEDLAALNANHIRGAIIGKALYENRIVLRDAVNLFEGTK